MTRGRDKVLGGTGQGTLERRRRRDGARTYQKTSEIHATSSAGTLA